MSVEDRHFREKRSDAASTRLLAGILLILASAQYLAGEAIAASAWSSPTYSYISNFISDLGYRGPLALFMGREIYSPLHWFMNGAFLLFGLLTFSAAALLARHLKASGSRTLMLGIYGAQFGGLILLVIFPESPEGLIDGTMAFHGLAALLAIGGGNLGAVFSSHWRDDVALPMSVQRVGLVLGILGIVAFVCLFLSPASLAGLVERMAVYTTTIWNIVWGVALIRGRYTPLGHGRI